MRGSTSCFLSLIGMFFTVTYMLIFGNNLLYLFVFTFFFFFSGNSNICPECGSDHVVQLAAQSPPYCSTPIRGSSRPDSEDDHLDIKVFVFTKTVKHFLFCLFSRVSHLFLRWSQGDHTDASVSSSPILRAATTTEDPTFITAQGSSFFTETGRGDTSGISYNTDCQSKEDLAGSYHYTAESATPPDVHTHPAGRSTPNGEFIIFSPSWLEILKCLKMLLIRNPQKQTFLLVNTGEQWSLDKPCRQNIDTGMYRITSTLESTHWCQNPYFYWKPLKAPQLKLLLKLKRLKQRGLHNRDNQKIKQYKQETNSK